MNAKQGENDKLLDPKIVEISKLRTLIDQQAQEIEKLKLIHEDYRRTALARIDYEVREKDTALSSLKLAIKALGYYAQMQTKCEPLNLDGGIFAKSTLEQIRRGKET